MKDKLESLQIIRGFAACLVAMCHIWNDGILPKTFVDLGPFGVDLFFVLSGFIMCLTVKLDTGKRFTNSILFLKKRIVRIFPIYLICSIPLIMFVSYAEGIKNLFFYIGNILLLPSFINESSYRLALPPGWSLVYEMLFYYIFSLLLLVFLNKNKLIFSLIAILTLLVAYIQLTGIQGPQFGWVNLTYIIGDTLLLNFALGCLSYIIYSSLKNRMNFAPWQSISLLIILMFLVMILIQHQLPRFISSGIPAFVIIIIFLFTKNSSTQNQWIKKAVFVGDASYSIYLTHFYFAFFKLKILSFIGQYIDNKTLLVNLVDMSLLSMAIVLGCAFYYYLEKPIIHHLSKIIKKQTVKEYNTPKTVSIN
ncbi:MAG: hypothetical protein H6Q14_1155 [Bacteroidetes bacterium]|nr:hypothetical protein [Bacteroidota bacterium]